MTITQEQIQNILRDAGAHRWSPVVPCDVAVDEGIRTSCAMNQCGSFGKSWSCPPALEPVSVWKERIHAFDQGMLFQVDYPMEDVFDYASMEEGALRFYALCRQLEKRLRTQGMSSLVLGAGACRECRQCTYPDAPCVRADGPPLSLEACGIHVTQLCETARVPYNFGDDTVTYTGLVLWNG